MKYDIDVRIKDDGFSMTGLSKSEFLEELEINFNNGYTRIEAIKYNDKGIQAKASYVRGKEGFVIMKRRKE
jgi:hypothetical protein